MDFNELYSKSQDPWAHHLRVSLQEYDHRYLKILSRYVESPQRILEIACGSGYFSVELAKKYTSSTVQACDISPRAIAIAKITHCIKNLVFVIDKIPELGQISGPYDLIVLNEALCYLNNEDRIKTIKKIKNLLKPSGYFFISSNIGEKYFTTNQLKDFVEINFGQILHLEYNYGRFYYDLIEIPFLEIDRRADKIIEKFPLLSPIMNLTKCVCRFILRNKLIFIFFQKSCLYLLKNAGITNIYILAQKPFTQLHE